MATLRLRNGMKVTVPDEVASDYTAQGLTLSGGEAPVAQKRRRTSSTKPRAQKPKAAPPADPTPPVIEQG